MYRFTAKRRLSNQALFTGVALALVIFFALSSERGETPLHGQTGSDQCVGLTHIQPEVDCCLPGPFSTNTIRCTITGHNRGPNDSYDYDVRFQSWNQRGDSTATFVSRGAGTHIPFPDGDGPETRTYARGIYGFDKRIVRMSTGTIPAEQSASGVVTVQIQGSYGGLRVKLANMRSSKDQYDRMTSFDDDYTQVNFNQGTIPSCEVDRQPRFGNGNQPRETTELCPPEPGSERACARCARCGNGIPRSCTRDDCDSQGTSCAYAPDTFLHWELPWGTCHKASICEGGGIPQDPGMIDITDLTCEPVYENLETNSFSMLDTTDDYIIVDQDNLDNVPQLTIAFCAEGHGTPITKGIETNYEGAYLMKINRPGIVTFPYQHVWRTGERTEPGEVMQSVISEQFIRDDTDLQNDLHHYTALYEFNPDVPKTGTNDRVNLKFYRDGVPKAFIPTTRRPFPDLGIPYAPRYPFVIGGENYNDFVNLAIRQRDAFEGDISKIRVYDCALSPAEVDALAQDCTDSIEEGSALFVHEPEETRSQYFLYNENRYNETGRDQQRTFFEWNSIFNLAFTASGETLRVGSLTLFASGASLAGVNAIELYAEKEFEIDGRIQTHKFPVPEGILRRENCEHSVPTEDVNGNTITAFCGRNFGNVGTLITDPIFLTVPEGETVTLHAVIQWQNNLRENSLPDVQRFHFLVTADREYESVQAVDLRQNDVDSTMEDEVILGRTTVGPDVPIVSKQHVIAKTKLSLEDAALAGCFRIADGPTRIGEATFSDVAVFNSSGFPVSPHVAYRGIVRIQDLLFTVHTGNVEIDGNSFVLAVENPSVPLDPESVLANPSLHTECDARRNGNEYEVICEGIDSITGVCRPSSCYTSNGQVFTTPYPFTLFANVTNPSIDDSKTSFIQMRLEDFTDSDAEEFGEANDESHLYWTYFTNPEPLDFYHIARESDAAYFMPIYGTEEQILDTEHGTYCEVDGDRTTFQCAIDNRRDRPPQYLDLCERNLGGVCIPHGGTFCDNNFNWHDDSLEYLSGSDRLLNGMFCEDLEDLEACVAAEGFCKSFHPYTCNPLPTASSSSSVSQSSDQSSVSSEKSSEISSDAASSELSCSISNVPPETCAPRVVHEEPQAFFGVSEELSSSDLTEMTFMSCVHLLQPFSGFVTPDVATSFGFTLRLTREASPGTGIIPSFIGQLENSGGSTQITVLEGSAQEYINAGKHHLTITYANGTMGLYQDGAITASRGVPGTVRMQDPQTLFLGTPALNASMDQTRFYECKLSDAEIRMFADACRNNTPLPEPECGSSVSSVQSSEIASSVSSDIHQCNCSINIFACGSIDDPDEERDCYAEECSRAPGSLCDFYVYDSSLPIAGTVGLFWRHPIENVYYVCGAPQDQIDQCMEPSSTSSVANSSAVSESSDGASSLSGSSVSSDSISSDAESASSTSLVSSLSSDESCTDSDGGRVYNERGTASGGGIEREDRCLDEDILIEYYCEDDGSVASERHFCAENEVCEEGACILRAAPECPNLCGNDVCDFTKGETAENCPDDCGGTCTDIEEMVIRCDEPGTDDCDYCPRCGSSASSEAPEVICCPTDTLTCTVTSTCDGTTYGTIEDCTENCVAASSVASDASSAASDDSSDAASSEDTSESDSSDGERSSVSSEAASDDSSHGASSDDSSDGESSAVSSDIASSEASSDADSSDAASEGASSADSSDTDSSAESSQEQSEGTSSIIIASSDASEETSDASSSEADSEQSDRSEASSESSEEPCGNGRFDLGEHCDRGIEICNQQRECDFNTCTCVLKEPLPRCGDGIVQESEGEQCDYRVDICTIGRECDVATCTCVPILSSSSSTRSEAGQQNSTSSFSSRSSVTLVSIPGCGNAIFDQGEQCEKGIDICRGGRSCNEQTCTCDPDSLQPNCGNGILTPDEQCEVGKDVCSGSRICNLATCTCILSELSDDNGDGDEDDGIVLNNPVRSRVGSTEDPEHTRTKVATAIQEQVAQQTLSAAERQIARELPLPIQPLFPSPFERQTQFTQFPNVQPLPESLPLAQLQALSQTRAPVGDTGPGAVIAVASGIGAGIAWARRKRQNRNS